MKNKKNIKPSYNKYDIRRHPGSNLYWVDDVRRVYPLVPVDLVAELFEVENHNQAAVPLESYPKQLPERPGREYTKLRAEAIASGAVQTRWFTKEQDDAYQG